MLGVYVPVIVKSNVCALLLEFQSCWSRAVVCAVLISVPVPVINALMVNIILFWLVSVPMFQIPVVGLYVPPLVSDVHVNPVGNRSVICSPVALSGPLLVAVMV